MEGGRVLGRGSGRLAVPCAAWGRVRAHQVPHPATEERALLF